MEREVPGIFDPVEPDFGDDPTLPIPVEAIRAYSVGQLPLPVTLTRLRVEAQDDLEMRVARVKVDGRWIPL